VCVCVCVCVSDESPGICNITNWVTLATFPEASKVVETVGSESSNTKAIITY